MRGSRETLEKRFWSKVEIPKQRNGCYIWTGAKLASGYGAILLEGKTLVAHKASWLIHNGKLPEDGIVVCHKCDIRECVRLDHLFLGTKADNSWDMAVKFRGTASLTANQVKYIRSNKLSHAALARELNISVYVVEDARRFRTYKHVI